MNTMKRMKALSVLMAVTLSGCASLSGYQPTVDTYGDANAANLQEDMKQCEQLAGQASSFAKETLMGAGIGGLLGGGGGAALGAVIGNPAIGAAAGAGVLGIAGGAYAGIKADDKYKTAYNQCLRGRGHRVL